jgi:hypothetical protein
METKAPGDALTTRDVWMRGLFMLLLMIGFSVGQWLMNVLAVMQFVWLLLAREPNQFIASFGNSLSIWLAEVGRFLTGATDDKPFPWARWPNDTASPPQVTSSRPDNIGGTP